MHGLNQQNHARPILLFLNLRREAASSSLDLLHLGTATKHYGVRRRLGVSVSEREIICSKIWRQD